MECTHIGIEDHTEHEGGGTHDVTKLIRGYTGQKRLGITGIQGIIDAFNAIYWTKESWLFSSTGSAQGSCSNAD